MSTVTASVVLYNTPAHQLERLIGCVERSSIRPQLFLIDNSPSATELPRPTSPSLIYIRAAQNNGYGAGHNIALRKVLESSRFHFVLNPDIAFGPDELAKMIQFMEHNEDVGQLMPRVIYPDGSLQYLCKRIPTPADLLLRRFMVGPLEKLTEGQRGRFELRFTGYDRQMDVPYLSGCFMLFRTAALQKAGLFDERFFMYGEDIDISRRMHANFRTLYFPGATIVHDHARESYKSLRALLVHIVNLVRYFNKWGWFRDQERTRVNRRILRQLEDMGSGSEDHARQMCHEGEGK